MSSPGPSVQHTIDEGLLIELSAVRMAVKNQIIIGALREYADFDAERYVEFAVRQLKKQARQNRADAKRVSREKKRLPSSGLSYDWSELVRLDHKRLAKRRKVHLGLEVALRAVAKDEAKLAEIVTISQHNASDEINAALTTRLGAEVITEHDPDYIIGREERIEELMRVDLEALRQERAPRSSWM